MPGAAWTHLEVKGIPMDSGGHVGNRSRRHRGDAPRSTAASSTTRAARASFADLLTRLAGAADPQLFHCTAGKDRTGWAAAMLLHVAGVADDVIRRDYLLTNTVSTGTRDKYLGMVREHLGADKVAVYERVLVADEDYLTCGLRRRDRGVRLARLLPQRRTRAERRATRRAPRAAPACVRPRISSAAPRPAP